MSGNKKENTELQYEAERDYVKRFIAEQYVSRGYYIHFHRNIEIYGVVKGEVYVTIAGESCTLKEGQIAVINGFESHSYEIDDEAEIFYFHVGTVVRTRFQAAVSEPEIAEMAARTQAERNHYLANQKSDDKRRKVVGFKENGFRMLSFCGYH